jgi:signal transduction histidine kinase
MTPLRLPITIRVPAVVMLFMVAVSAFASERVLTRLDQTQTRHIGSLSAVYLEGLSLALVDAMVREDIWQVFDVLDRSHRRPAGLRPAETIVASPEGLVIASSDPLRIPSQTTLPEDYRLAFGNEPSVVVRAGPAVAIAKRDVVYEGRSIGSIYAKVDIAPQIAERNDVLRTLILTNALLTLVLAALASFIVARMMRPMRILTHHLERSGTESVRAIPADVVASARPEYRRTFAAYNTLAKAMQERESMAAQLAEEERLASLGRLASGMAHEINNPLGGLFNAIDTLKRHGSHERVRTKSIELIERGLKGIRDVVRSALMTYRADRDHRDLRPEDVDDMHLLVSPEARRKGVQLVWRCQIPHDIPVPASTVRQVLLNLVLNACQASPRDGWTCVAITTDQVRLQIVVEDSGPGLPVRAAEILSGSAVLPAPIGEGSGLGLWMTNRLVRECGGEVSVETNLKGGARLTVKIPLGEGAGQRGGLRDVA